MSKLTPQSLIFKRSTGWTGPSAKEWVREHGYGRVLFLDITKNYVRLRLADPSKFTFLRTVTFGRGIKVIMGELKKPKRKNPESWEDPHKGDPLWERLCEVEDMLATGAEYGGRRRVDLEHEYTTLRAQWKKLHPSRMSRKNPPRSSRTGRFTKRSR